MNYLIEKLEECPTCGESKDGWHYDFQRCDRCDKKSKELESSIERMARMVRKRPAQRGVLSTGEFLAVAFVLDRPSWIRQSGYTMLSAMDRLGDEWYRAALAVQKSGLY